MDQLVGTVAKSGTKREQLLDTGRALILERGFAAATVDRICEAAGVTKGAFFHYFEDKDELGKAVAARFASDLVSAYQAAPFREVSDPLERVYAYIDFTVDVTRGPLLANGCLIGALSVELAQTHPEVRALCSLTFEGWARDLENLLRDAKGGYPKGASFEPQAVARFFLVTVEGALVLARAHQDPSVVSEALGEFRTYVERLFGEGAKRGRDSRARTRPRR